MNENDILDRYRQLERFERLERHQETHRLLLRDLCCLIRETAQELKERGNADAEHIEDEMDRIFRRYQWTLSIDGPEDEL